MANSVMHIPKIKTVTVSGTPNQYGALLFNNEANAVADRITGIVAISSSRAMVNIMKQGTTYYFACYHITDRADFTDPISITVAYLDC